MSLKKILLSTLILMNIGKVLAQDKLPLTGWSSSTYREDVFTLFSYPQLEVTLDCASFLYGISIKGPNGKKFFMLYESECYSIYENLKLWFDSGESACLKLDFTQKDWELSKTTYDCQ